MIKLNVNIFLFYSKIFIYKYL